MWARNARSLQVEAPTIAGWYIYGLMIPAASSLVALAALAFCWGLANHFGLNIIILLLGRANEERRGAVLALNSAVSYAGALVGAGLFGAAYERGGFLPTAALAAGCLTGALVVAVTARVGQVPDRTEAVSCSSERPETACASIWVCRKGAGGRRCTTSSNDGTPLAKSPDLPEPPSGSRDDRPFSQESKVPQGH